MNNGLPRKILCTLIGIAFIAAGSSGASAATYTVTIKTITVSKVKYGKSATIKPIVTSSGRATVTSMRLTVTKGGKTIRKSVKSAALKAGRYHVTTHVKYKTYNYVTKHRTVSKRVPVYRSGDDVQANCTITTLYGASEYASTCQPVSKSPDAFDSGGSLTDNGDGTWTLSEDGTGRFQATIAAADHDALLNMPFNGSIMTDRDLLSTSKHKVVESYKKRIYSNHTKSRTQSLTVKQSPKPRTCATYSDFKSVNVDFDDPETFGDAQSTVNHKLHSRGVRSQFDDSDGSIIEFRDYKTCSKDAILSIGYFNGFAYTKDYYN